MWMLGNFRDRLGAKRKGGKSVEIVVVASNSVFSSWGWHAFFFLRVLRTDE
jgi:hypothetical protein